MIAAMTILAGVLFMLLLMEYRVHVRRLNSIPIRVHVNGTREKSSVTRLIAGALREHGLKIFAKTTGTLPRVIMDDSREYPVYRPARANIIEQLRIVALAAGNEADAIVIECMAIQPHLQSLTELKFIRATHGVITNARAEHLDVMGPSERDVVLALSGSAPYKGKLFTAEQDYLDEFRTACEDRQSELYGVIERDKLGAEIENHGFRFCKYRNSWFFFLLFLLISMN